MCPSCNVITFLKVRCIKGFYYLVRVCPNCNHLVIIGERRIYQREAWKDLRDHQSLCIHTN